MKRNAQKSHLAILYAATLLVAATNSIAPTIFESGTLGPTGITWTDLQDQVVPGTSVHSSNFVGARFELTQVVAISEIGGHFAAPSAGTFFGAIVKLDDANDFPNSSDLSTPDVLGVTTITFPSPSAEVFGSLPLTLTPGWYGLVFGSGLFNTIDFGGAVRNGIDIGAPSYIAYNPNLAWFNLDLFGTFFDNHRFVVRGSFVPEPNAMQLALLTTLTLG